MLKQYGVKASENLFSLQDIITRAQKITERSIKLFEMKFKMLFSYTTFDQ